MDDEFRNNLVDLLKKAHIGITQLNSNLIAYDSIENKDKISELVSLFGDLLKCLDKNLEKIRMDKEKIDKEKIDKEKPIIIEQPGVIQSIIEIGNVSDCVITCNPTVEDCPNIITDEDEDCNKYKNDSIIFNTLRVIKRKLYNAMVSVGKAIYSMYSYFVN